MAGKKKRLTKAELKQRKEVREQLRQEGILPPPKQRLNRKKFAKEVINESKDLNTYEDLIYLKIAIECMTPSLEYAGHITPEDVGVLKALKVAVDLKKFYEAKRNSGIKECAIGEIYDKVIKPIKAL